MTTRTFAAALLLGLALVFAGAPAHAEEGGEGPSGVEEQIKKKLEEILKLMKENEEALLRASTGTSEKPKRVDLDVPEPPGKSGGSNESGQGSSGGSSGGASGGSSGSSGGTKGAEIGRKMRELIEGQRKNGGRIPGEMGALLKMIPTRSGQGQGQPQDGKDPKGKQEQEQEARDGRKEFEQSQQNQNEPKGGQESKQDPSKGNPKGGKPEDPKSDDSKRPDNVPAWMATLPPEIRDAMAGGRAEDVPAKYRHLIKRYHLWLQKNRKP